MDGRCWEKKSAKKKASYWKWLAAAAILCVAMLAANGDVRAQVKAWMNQWALRAGISYDEHVSPYEQEVNLELKNGDYTLFVYTIGQTSVF